MQIGRKDVLWNYAATFLQLGAGIILLPLILRAFPADIMAVWVIFQTVVLLSSLLDLGFYPSFSRNISYVMSGVKTLKKHGVEAVEDSGAGIDYGLLKGIIGAMKWFYARMALLLLLLLSTVGTWYINTVLRDFDGDRTEIYAAWALLCIINACQLYTSYFDALLQGQGKIKEGKQIQIAGQTAYLLAAILLITFRFNLIAVVAAQALSFIIRRTLSYRAVYTPQLRSRLASVPTRPQSEILRPILPNALKFALSGIGGLLVTRFSVIIGALYLSLDDVASYGTTVQIIGVIASVSTVYLTTYFPQIAQYHVHEQKAAIRSIYLRSCWMMLFAYIAGGGALLLFGDPLLHLIRSQTQLLTPAAIIALLVVNLLYSSQSIAGLVIVQRNTVPFYKADLITGAATLALLLVFFRFTDLGTWTMILAPGIASACYNSWKWTALLIRELRIGFRDVAAALIYFIAKINRKKAA